MDLEVIVQEKVNELVASGTVATIIETHLRKTIDGIMGGMLGEYSEFGKKIKDAIGNKLEIQLDKLNIDNYTGMVCQVIEQALNNTSLDSAKEKIGNKVSEVLGRIEKKHWMLSEIVNKYIYSLHSESARADLEVKEETYGNYIYLGERSGSSRSVYGDTKRHDFTIHMDKKKVTIFIFNPTFHFIKT